MRKIANLLINRRYVMLAIMLVLTIVCSFLATTVPINKDRTEYLADNSNMKQGLAILETDFPETEEKSSIRVMFDDLAPEQINDVKARLEAIQNVSSVTYDADSDSYNKNNHTLFVVNSKFDYNTDEEKAIEDAIKNRFAEYKMAYRNNDIQSTKVPLWLFLSALTLTIIILLIMSDSWLDPILFLVTIGVAVVINMGTNFFLPYIDEMTASVGPILQLVLSMDYSIMLMNRYRQEKNKQDNKLDVMKTALEGSISSIASSSYTTVVGLLALVFLSFKLGPELGIVLAKGVFISMLCVFTILPAMILFLDKWLEKTKKKSPHIPMGLLSKISRKLRLIMPVVFVVLFVGFYILQDFTDITFTEKSEDPLADIFPKENTVVLLYNNEDEKNIGGIISELEKDERITGILGYSNTLGKELDAREMSEAINEMSDESTIDEDIVRVLYFIAADGEMPVLTVAGFMEFITDTVLQNETLSEYLDDNIRNNAEYFEKFSDREKLTTAMTAGEMSDFLGIDKEDIEHLYLYYTIQNGVADSGTMTLPVFVDFVLNVAAKDENYGAMFDSAALSSLKQMQAYTDTDTVQAKRTVTELATIPGIDESTAKTAFVLDNAGDVSGKTMTVFAFSTFLHDHLVNDPIFGTYFDEASKAQVQTMNALIQLSVSKQALTPEQMAQTLGMDKESVSGLYYLYFLTDPAFQQEAAAMKMPLTDFLTLLKSTASGEQSAQLAQMEQMINLAVSRQPLDTATMAGVTGMTANEVSAIYMMNSAEAMTLPDFLTAALQLAPDNVQLQQINQIVQLAASGTPLNASTLASVFGIETSQVHQLSALILSSQKAIALADFTGFLVNTVLTNEAYAGNFTTEQAAQLQQMNGIVQLAVSGTPLEASTLAQMFGMDMDMITTVFRLYHGADISGKTMSLKEFTDFILSDALISSIMDQASLEQLRILQKIINVSVNGITFSSSELAEFLGMETSQIEQLYILYLDKNSGSDSWKISPQSLVSFAVTDVLENEAFAEYFDEEAADNLKSGQSLIEAVVSEKSYTVSQMSELLMSLTYDISENEIEVMYLFYGGVNDTDADIKMTIPQLFDFLCDELMDDERFAVFFDEETRMDVLNSKTDLNDAIAQMKGATYSRLVLISDYEDESPETLAYIAKLDGLCSTYLSEYYLVGNSVMVSEMKETFDDEYLMISLITAIAIFLVVLITFRRPILPLILTLLVQCGVFITVTVIGAYSGSMYYLALLIVQSILMGATIDYGILFCNFYRESRKTMDISEAIKAAYEGSIHTIMTSGSILVLVLASLGIFASSAMISEVSITLSIGVFVAIMLILLVLPGLVVSCDKLISKKR